MDPISPIDPSVETLWEHLKTTILQVSEETLGFSTGKNKAWFDENNQEIQELLAKKRSAHQAHLAQPTRPLKKGAFRLVCGNLQRKLRGIQNDWWTRIAERTQLCTDTRDYRGFYETLRAVYGPSYQVQSPLRSPYGQTLFTDKASILNRWLEHFQTLFSATRVVHDSAIFRIPQQPVFTELEAALTLEQTVMALKQLKSSKADDV